MKGFRSLILAVGMVLPMASFAADYQWLTFRMADNSEVSVAADNLSINYRDANLYLKSATVDQTIAVAQIKTMRFTSSAAGINDVDANLPGETDYYTVSGVKVGRFTSIEDARKNLPSGIYVTKGEVKTFKVIF